MKRRDIISGSAAALIAAKSLPEFLTKESEEFLVKESDKEYLYQGRIKGYQDHQIIESGLKITAIETYSAAEVCLDIRLQGTSGEGIARQATGQCRNQTGTRAY